MKLNVDRAQLLAAVGVVSKACATRTPRPELMCIKLNATEKGGPLALSATDGEVAIAMPLAMVDVQTPGDKPVLIPAAKLQAILNADPATVVTVEVLGQALVSIKSEDAQYKIFGYDTDLGVPPALKDTDPTLVIAANDLATALGCCKKAMAADSSRYAIAGLCFAFKRDRTDVVATDGRRLALVKWAATPGIVNKSFILPARAVGLLEQLCELEFDGTDATKATIRFDDNSVEVSFREGDKLLAKFRTSTVQGAFPPYEEVIPKDNDRKVVMNRETLASGLRRARLMVSQESSGVRFNFLAASSGFKGKLTLESRTVEKGEASIECELAEAMEGPELTIGFNPAFIMDAMVDGEAVTLRMKAPGKPVVVESGPCVSVVMPVTLQ